MTPSPGFKEQERFTYADYITCPDDERWELIDGVAYMMSPAPTRKHQELSGNMHSMLHQYLKGKSCKVYAAPFDVRLPEIENASDEEIETVVQPDIVVICDLSKLDDRGCKGAPDLVLEITSPSSGSYDLTTKFDLYQRHAVKEYWIVLPEEEAIMVFKLLDSGLYGSPDRFGRTDQIAVTMLGDLIINLEDVFAE